MAWLTKRSYTVTLPDGSTERRRCSHWTICWRDATGRVKSVKGYTDRAATKQRAAELERALARGESGLAPNPYKGHKARPFAEHVAEYLADLRTQGLDDQYVYNAEKRLAILAAGCGWKALGDVEPNSFIRWREAERAAKCKRRGHLAEKLSAETLNQYLRTVRAFLSWCAKNGRIEGVRVRGRMTAVALADVGTVDGPAVRKRRALTDAQVSALLAVAGDRGIVYRTGLATGLRRQEMVDLQWGDVQLRAIRPYVRLRREATKARRGDRLELPLSLADELRKRKPEGAKDCDPVFPEGVPPIEQWRADLAAAGIPYKDDLGRQADLHGLRKTLCTRLHRAGRPLAEAMRVMRHSSERLTMVDYADDDQLAGEPLPELLPAETPAATTGQAAAGGA